MNKISIIIPTLNEADNIGKLLEYLLDNSVYENISEIIVVDGGSIDDTVLKVNFAIKNNAKIKLQNSTKGRAKQMNEGAKRATGSIFYFLHADSFPPQNFDQYVIDEVEKGNLAGCFRMQFDSTHWWLRLASWLTQFSWRACRGGDQSQFIAKSLFEEIGGFDESFIIYEDNDLINKLYVKKQFIVINKKLKTSARLYERVGIWKLQYHFWVIYIKKWLGATPKELYRYYLDNIAAKYKN